MYTTASGVQIPQGTDSFSPTTQFKNWADKAATYENRVIVATDTERNALAAPVRRDGLACYVTGTGVTWEYRGSTWHRVGLTLTGRAVRSAAALAFGSSDFTNVSTSTWWSTTAPQGQVAGFDAYNNGWTVPVTGVYRVGYELVTQAIGFFAGVTVNKATGVVYQDLKCAASAPPQGGIAAASASRELYLVAGDVVRLFAIANSGTPSTVPSMGYFALTWVRDA